MSVIIFVIFIGIIFFMLMNIYNCRYDYKCGYAGGARVKDLDKHPRSRSENVVIDYLEKITGAKFPTCYPDWLSWHGKSLELDGYNESLKIALEFSGPLHTKWFPSREPYEKYFARIVRDVVKVRKCKRQRVNLIVIDMSLPAKHWRDYILSRLYDFGIVKQTLNYIAPQVAAVYRNEQLERELGLSGEMSTAEKI